MSHASVGSLCLLTLIGSACAPDRSPTAATLVPAHGAADAVGDRSNDFSIIPGVVNICAFFPSSAGVGVATALFVAGGPPGEDVIAGVQSLTPVPHCLESWNAGSSATVDLTATLQGVTPGYVLDRIVRTTGDGAGSEWSAPLTGVTAATVAVSDRIGGAIWFKFRDVDRPPVGGEGCTPGYWKQRQHFDAWPAPHVPGTSFAAVFADAFPGKTLRQVLGAKGGGLNALGRHTVAALLNAANPSVDYDLTAAEVVAAFNAAYASGSRRAMLAQKDVFDMLNNQGCPLN